MRKTNILLIEPDWDIAQITLLALGLDQRVEARHLAGGEEAVQLLRQGRWRPDLILSSLAMPGLSDLQLLETLKREGLKDVPMVLLTPGMDRYEPAHLRRQGIHSVLAMPFNPLTLSEDLLTRIKHPRAYA